ncbi:hypothetical protein Tco_1184651, partial [Tanacetum coccineum]
LASELDCVEGRHLKSRKSLRKAEKIKSHVASKAEVVTSKMEKTDDFRPTAPGHSLGVGEIMIKEVKLGKKVVDKVLSRHSKMEDETPFNQKADSLILKSRVQDLCQSSYVHFCKITSELKLENGENNAVTGYDNCETDNRKIILLVEYLLFGYVNSYEVMARLIGSIRIQSKLQSVLRVYTSSFYGVNSDEKRSFKVGYALKNSYIVLVLTRFLAVM